VPFHLTWQREPTAVPDASPLAYGVLSTWRVPADKPSPSPGPAAGLRHLR
jgi:hypothetical protein